MDLRRRYEEAKARAAAAYAALTDTLEKVENAKAIRVVLARNTRVSKLPSKD